MLVLKERPPTAAPAWEEGRVLAPMAASRYLLADGRAAVPAASCLLVPEAGDRVLLVATGDDLFVVHVLERAGQEAARLHVVGASELRIEQQAVALHAQRKLALLALGDVELTAAQGSVQISGRNLFVTAVDSLVENARHRVAQVHHYLLQVKQLWRVQSRQGLVTADGDLKLDAERVSVG